ncbi:MAG TPA: DedA family protein [Burkholderiales bacterium]|nr:DedA family protein [Burkholderiales bacterium]
MEVIASFFDLLAHLDRHLLSLLQIYGGWIYPILFLIIFCETGLVVTPFLPGDSLLFVTGTLTATGALNVQGVATLLMAAAFLGDNTNYWIGRYLGPRVFRKERSHFFNRRYLERTQIFYEKHGGKTILIARFIPVIRTFAPFVAGIGRMRYPRFLLYSFGGSVFWISFFVFGGFYFGNVPVVRQNLTVFIMLIIFVSILPGVIEYLRALRGRAEPR